MDQFFNLKKKVAQYKDVLSNTRAYRTVWQESLKQRILDVMNDINEATELNLKIDVKADLENLEAIVVSLGTVKSGMYQEMEEGIKRHMIKNNGGLIYQQLFNGKIIVLINYPYIENYGQPSPPKTIGIYRPEELLDPHFIRHMEEFIREITNWEDYDDDEPNKKLGFDLNFNGGNQEA